jgi:hypothetical protein
VRLLHAHIGQLALRGAQLVNKADPVLSLANAVVTTIVLHSEVVCPEGRWMADWDRARHMGSIGRLRVPQQQDRGRTADRVACGRRAGHRRWTHPHQSRLLLYVATHTAQTHNPNSPCSLTEQIGVGIGHSLPVGTTGIQGYCDFDTTQRLGPSSDLDYLGAPTLYMGTGHPLHRCARQGQFGYT